MLGQELRRTCVDLVSNHIVRPVFPSQKFVCPLTYVEEWCAKRKYVHLSNALINGSALRQRGELVPCELGQPHLALLGRLLGADQTDLLLSRDRLSFDLTDQLYVIGVAVRDLHCEGSLSWLMPDLPSEELRWRWTLWQVVFQEIR